MLTDDAYERYFTKDGAGTDTRLVTFLSVEEQYRSHVLDIRHIFTADDCELCGPRLRLKGFREANIVLW